METDKETIFTTEKNTDELNFMSVKISSEALINSTRNQTNVEKVLTKNNAETKIYNSDIHVHNYI